MSAAQIRLTLLSSINVSTRALTRPATAASTGALTDFFARHDYRIGTALSNQDPS